MFFARAIQDFAAADEEHLSVKAGDFLVVEKTFGNPGFWLAVLELENKGWIPIDHLKQVETTDIWDDELEELDDSGNEDEHKEEHRHLDSIAEGEEEEMKDAGMSPAELLKFRKAAKQKQLADFRALEEKLLAKKEKTLAAFASIGYEDYLDTITREVRSTEIRLLRAGVNKAMPTATMQSEELQRELEWQAQSRIAMEQRPDYSPPVLIEKQFVFTAEGGLSKEVNKEHIVYAGWVTYKKAANLKKWKKRFLVLYKASLVQYLKPGDTSTKSVMAVDFKKPGEFKKHANSDMPCFDIGEGKKGWHLYAESEEENKQWARALELVHLLSKTDDPRMAGWIRATQFNVPGSRTVEKVPVPMVLNGSSGMLNKDSIMIMEWLLSHEAAEAVSLLETMYCGLTAQNAEALISASRRHPTPTLTIVNLSHNNLRGGIGAWVDHPTLREVILHDCKLDDASLETLRGRTLTAPLQRLELRDNDISDAGASALVELLNSAANSTITYLGLEKNRVGDKGASSLAELLATTDSLKMLELQNNHIGDRGIMALADAVKINKSLRSLNLAGNNDINDAGMGALSHMSQRSTVLEVLKVDDPQHLKNARKAAGDPLVLGAEAMGALRVLCSYGIKARK